MGCVSSKLYKTQEFNRDSLFNNADFTTTHHVVSLTSSTYGFLKLDSSEPKRSPFREGTELHYHIDLHKPDHNVLYETEIINAWELMGDLDDEMGITKSPNLILSSHSHQVPGMGTRNQPKFLFNQMSNSPKKQRRFSGKENKQRVVEFENRGAMTTTTQQVLKPFRSIENLQKVPNLKQLSVKTSSTPLDLNADSFRSDSAFLTPKQSFSPLFDPELLTSFEIELDEEREQFKNVVSPEPRNSKLQESECELFEKKCPPDGENAVIIYTTTLRGIRKTFEDCNRVRSVIESHDVYMIERDVSMDSGLREELRKLIGKNEIRLPVVFVKGRLIGGVEEFVKIEEEGMLEVLFKGIPRAQVLCDRCLGVRFLMCVDCSGSCRVLDEEQNKLVRCESCNENGLIQCPFCC